jgi:hypothetical protein
MRTADWLLRLMRRFQALTLKRMLAVIYNHLSTGFSVSVAFSVHTVWPFPEEMTTQEARLGVYVYRKSGVAGFTPE